MVEQGNVAKRFSDYLLTYAPRISWPLHEFQMRTKRAEYAKAHPEVAEAFAQSIAWESHERYPCEWEKETVFKALKATYNDRSAYLHTGKMTKHSSIDASNVYFEIRHESTKEVLSRSTWVDDEGKSHTVPIHKVREVLIPKFELMTAVARIAMINYLFKMAQKELAQQQATTAPET